LPRPKEFDEADVLEKAMRCFWERGYQATSIRDLADTMGLTTASLYNAFGDKRSLYRRSLQRYLSESVRERIDRLERRYTSYATLEAFFKEIIDKSVRDRRRRGCMLVNSALEIAPHDATFRKLVSRELKAIQAFFHRCVAAGQKDGTISKAIRAEDQAKMLLSVLLGVRVMARTRPQRDVLEAAAKSALSILKRQPRP
jgi:TetR/AcrR family transcriptional repressor of nem operon